MQVWNALHATRCKYRTQKIAISAPSHNFVRPYLCNKGMYLQSEENLLNSNASSTCPLNMVNFGPLAAEICWQVWGTPANFNGFRILAALLHGTLVVGVGVSQTVALNRGCHLYSTERPSRWTFLVCLGIGMLNDHQRIECWIFYWFVNIRFWKLHHLPVCRNKFIATTLANTMCSAVSYHWPCLAIRGSRTCRQQCNGKCLLKHKITCACGQMVSL